MLGRDQPQPGGQLSPIAEYFSVRNRCHYRGTNHGADSFRLCNPLTGFVSLKGLLDAFLHCFDAFVQRAQFIIESNE